jgi:hypothetical protein
MYQGIHAEGLTLSIVLKYEVCRYRQSFYSTVNVSVGCRHEAVRRPNTGPE